MEELIFSRKDDGFDSLISLELDVVVTCIQYTAVDFITLAPIGTDILPPPL